MKIATLKFKHKIALLPIFFISILIVFIFFFQIVNTKNRNLVEYMQNTYIPYIHLDNDLGAELKNLQRGFQDAVAAADNDKLESTKEIANKFDSLLAGAKNNAVIDKDTTIALISKFKNYSNLAYATSEKMINGDYSDETSVQMQKMVAEYNSIVNTLENIHSESKTFSDREISKVRNQAKTSSTILLLLIIASALLTIFFSLIIIRSLMADLGGEPAKVFAITREIANGNLSIEFDTNLKKQGIHGALQDMTEKLSSIISSVLSASNNVALASQQIKATTQQISQGANEQASTMEEFSSTLEELTQIVIKNDEAAAKASEMASLASSNIMINNEAVKDSSASMAEIVGKIAIVGEIAMQTNILSLNASVEAARAGDNGRGFAVVANEVRTLAARSRTAADEINRLSKSGVKTVEIARKQFEEIVPEIDLTSKLINEISVSSKEQSSSIHQINSAIQSLNQVAQENAASTEEMSASAEELATQADELKSMISFFKVDNTPQNSQLNLNKKSMRLLHTNDIENNSKEFLKKKEVV